MLSDARVRHKNLVPRIRYADFCHKKDDTQKPFYVFYNFIVDIFHLYYIICMHLRVFIFLLLTGLINILFAQKTFKNALSYTV